MICTNASIYFTRSIRYIRQVVMPYSRARTVLLRNYGKLENGPLNLCVFFCWFKTTVRINARCYRNLGSFQSFFVPTRDMCLQYHVRFQMYLHFPTQHFWSYMKTNRVGLCFKKFHGTKSWLECNEFDLWSPP